MFKKVFQELFRKFFNNKRKQDVLFDFMFDTFNRDSLIYAYNSIGILNYKTKKHSGEDFFLKKILKNKISDKKNAVIFDVGANKGDYSASLSELFPESSIYSFEPGHEAYLSLKDKLKGLKNIQAYNIGFDRKNNQTRLYNYEKEKDSEHATIFKSVFEEIHKKYEISSHIVQLKRIDSFCEENGISKIDFLKIDTEGCEYRVLQGCGDMLKNGNINIIQFEFNEMNVISRTFFKDFFELLPGYSFYRLGENGLIPLKEYQSFYEIFKYQNILALRNNKS